MQFKSSHNAKGNFRYFALAAICFLPWHFEAAFAQELPGQAVVSSELGADALLRTTVIPVSKSTDKKVVQWEKRSLSMIKWKEHPITTIKGGTARLITTFDRKGGSYGTGAVKYQLFLNNIPFVPDEMSVQLLDKNGFKTVEFKLYHENFHPVPGTSMMVASEEWTCLGKDYHKARDYVVK